MAVTSSRHHRSVARILLIVPTATYRARDFLAAADALGIEVVVGSDERHALGDLMGSRFLALPLHDPEATAEAIVAHDSRWPVDAVVSVDDVGAVAAATAASRLGLPHNPPEAVASARDKVAMRAALDRAEVPQPASDLLHPDTGEARWLAAAANVGYPCVVKPPTLAASQGVIRVDRPEDLLATIARVRAIAASAGVEADRPLLVERFVPGAEVALEGILRSGRLEVLAVFDKPDPLDGPYFEETIYVTPSRLPASGQRAAASAAAGAARALGLETGPVHAEVRVDAGRAWVIEVAARTIGGLCSRSLSFGTGHSLEELVLAQALGRSLDGDGAGREASGVLMMPIPRSGVLIGVDGRDEALRIPGIVGVEITIAPGRPVVAAPEGDRYLGFVFSRAATPGEVEAALRHAQRRLHVQVQPEGAG
jgi:biotin carboxylase